MIVVENNFKNANLVKKVDLADIVNFHKLIPIYKPTNIIQLSDNLYIKDESNRMGSNSFKILGASYALYKYVKKRYLKQCINYNDLKTFFFGSKLKVYTASDGNFGIAVALLCHMLNIESVVYLPQDTPLFYKKEIENYTNVVYVSGNYDNAVKECEKNCTSDDILLLDTSTNSNNFDNAINVMRGYTTIFHEINRFMPEYIFIQAGVGGLLAASIMYYKYIGYLQNVKIVCVEPQQYNSVQISLKNNQITKVDGSPTIINGLKCGIPSLAAWDFIKHGVDIAISISDNDCMNAYERLKKHTYTGYTGASGLAGYLSLKKIMDITHKRVLVINTEKVYN